MFRKRTHQRERRTFMRGVPKFWVPDLRDSGFLLHPSDCDDSGLPPDIQGSQEDSPGREKGPDKTGRGY